MTANPDIRITVAGGGSGVGVQQVGEGLVQIGNTGRALKGKGDAKYGLPELPLRHRRRGPGGQPRQQGAGHTARQAQVIFAGKIAQLEGPGRR